jgi:hypothetical protein
VTHEHLPANSNARGKLSYISNWDKNKREKNIKNKRKFGIGYDDCNLLFFPFRSTN